MNNIISFLFLISITSKAHANTLECPRSEGIANCQKEAQAFCKESSFNIKADSESYLITCGEGVAAKKEEPLEKEDSSTSGKIESKPIWKVAIGVGINSGGEANSDLKITNLTSLSSAQGEAEFDVDSGFNVNLEARFLRSQGWGLTLGLDIDFKREVNSGSFTFGGDTVNVSSSGEPDNFTAAVVYGNMVYKWDQFYIPFGLNLSFIDYKAVGLSVNTVPSIGAQLGMGYEFNEKFAFEVYSRALGFEFDYIDGNLGALFESGVMTNIGLRMKFIFF